jgi:glycosyltransferase involved in cell wall biosynthesis
MRERIFGLLKTLKWRLIVPCAWYLGLPHTWVAERMRLAPLLKNANGGNARATATTRPGGSIEERFPGAHRRSIFSASMVAETCRVLKDEWGVEGVQRYVEALVSRAPQYEPDIRWGAIRALRDENPAAGLDLGLTLLDAFPLRRFRLTMLRYLNQAGDIRRARALSEHVALEDQSAERTRDIFRARERLLDNGFTLPSGSAEPGYIPAVRRGFYLLHNSLPIDSGGYATRTHGLVCNMRRHGWDVECVTRLGYPLDIRSGGWAPPRQVVDGVPYYRIKDRGSSYRRVDAEQYLKLNAEAVLRLARRRKPVVVHGASNHINGLAAVYAGRRLGIPSVYEVRGLWELTRVSRQPEFEGSELFEMIAKLETQACLTADRVITITKALKTLMVERGVPSEKIEVVPNGVDIQRFSAPSGGDGEVRSRWSIPEGAIVFGYVGSMPQYEGLDDLIDAVARLKVDGLPAVYCLLVGDGDQLGKLTLRAQQQNVGDRVFFSGRVPHHEVGRYYAAMDVMVFPRKPQPVTEIVSPIKPFEAMALAKPILASDVAALAEIVSDGKTGVLFRKGDAEHLAECMTRLAQSIELRRCVGSAGQRWVREERDWSVLARRVTSIYEELTGSPVS